MSCMTILFLNLQITRSDIRPHTKLAVSLVIAYGHFNLPQRFVWGMYGLAYSLYHPRGTTRGGGGGGGGGGMQNFGKFRNNKS